MMRNIDKIRMMTPEELAEWLMVDWEYVKYNYIQTMTGAVEWFNKEANICPFCGKLISSHHIVYNAEKDRYDCPCPHCKKLLGEVEDD